MSEGCEGFAQGSPTASTEHGFSPKLLEWPL